MAQVAIGDQAQHAQNLAIARHRAADHVGEAGHHPFVEREARDPVEGCGKDRVAIRCVTHGYADNMEQAGILRPLSAGCTDAKENRDEP